MVEVGSSFAHEGLTHVASGGLKSAGDNSAAGGDESASSDRTTILGDLTIDKGATFEGFAGVNGTLSHPINELTGFRTLRAFQPGSCFALGRTDVTRITTTLRTHRSDGSRRTASAQELPELALRELPSRFAFYNDPCVPQQWLHCVKPCSEGLRVAALFFSIGVEQVETRQEIPVDVLIRAPEPMPSLPEFLFSVFARQRIVLTRLELSGIHHDHSRTGAFSLALEHLDELARSVQPLRTTVSAPSGRP